MTCLVKVRRLPHAEDLDVPTYKTENAAGLDLCSAVEMDLFPGETALVPTGFEIEIPRGYEGQVRVRSSITAKSNVIVPNAPGTIDADYRGELFVMLHKLDGRDDTAPFRIRRGQRIAQLVISPVAAALVAEVSELSSTRRGAGGFGSTGSGTGTGG